MTSSYDPPSGQLDPNGYMPEGYAPSNMVAAASYSDEDISIENENGTGPTGPETHFEAVNVSELLRNESQTLTSAPGDLPTDFGFEPSDPFNQYMGSEPDLSVRESRSKPQFPHTRSISQSTTPTFQDE